MRFVTIALVLGIALVQSELWFGKYGVRHVVEMEHGLAAQEKKNQEARNTNDRLDAEVRDLREGLEMVEERARLELGMVKPDEILVQVTDSATTVAESAQRAASVAAAAQLPAGSRPSSGGALTSRVR